MVRVGDKMPDGKLFVLGPEGPKEVEARSLFCNGVSLLFALPGAFTSVCSQKQVPEYMAKLQTFRQWGIKNVYCLSVNDPFVMNAWAGTLGVVPSTVTFLSDPECKYTRRLGMDQYLDGLGTRSLRYSALIDSDCYIALLNVDEPGGKTYKVSGPDYMLKRLQEHLHPKKNA
jgi:glutaredoxin/glutathione-dependent peroxiredoxin